jgi:hypothetical protein
VCPAAARGGGVGAPPPGGPAPAAAAAEAGERDGAGAASSAGARDEAGARNAAGAGDATDARDAAGAGDATDARNGAGAGETTGPRDGTRAPHDGAAAASVAGPIVRRADRFQVVVTVDADALREGSDAGQSILDGVRVPAETSRRIACDASLVVMTHDGAGNLLDVGRRTRTVPPAIRRALDHRDRGCRFPGCASRFCDAHHIRHWADGGATRLDNLVNLCRRHHRAVHEEGFRVSVTADGELCFQRPDGEPIPQVPAPPELGDDPVASLERDNVDAGLELGPWTATPGWRGERMDLDWTIRVLRR